MQTNIGHSIQEYCKKINSSIDRSLLISLFTAFLIILLFTVYYSMVKKRSVKQVQYLESREIINVPTSKTSAIFASKNGKTYTYSWCKGSSRIKETNRIYFSTEKDAQTSGRQLSKLCN